jgi:hypothetical protein
MNLLDIAYIRGSKAKERRREEREGDDGLRIYIRGPSRGALPKPGLGGLKGLLGRS